ncbi:MAG: glycosyltransferase family 2 protein, partial [Chloroflexi bacterium]
MDLTIVIVSFQVQAMLERCLESLALACRALTTQIIVIDNASTDQSVRMTRDRFPAVELIANDVNVGFARANNQGLERAQGKFWLLLNPDTEILTQDADALQKMVAFMETHPRAGACGPSLFYADGARQHSAFRFPSLAQIYMDLFPVNWRLRESRWNGRYSFR